MKEYLLKMLILESRNWEFSGCRRIQVGEQTKLPLTWESSDVRPLTGSVFFTLKWECGLKRRTSFYPQPFVLSAPPALHRVWSIRLVVVQWCHGPLLVSGCSKYLCLLVMVFSGHTSLSFAGNSYIKYRLSENSKEEDFKLALRLRTLQSNGIIMYTRANPCIILKVIKMGYLCPQTVLMLVFWLLDWGLKLFCLLSLESRSWLSGQGSSSETGKCANTPFPFVHSASELPLWRLGYLSLEWVQEPASFEL